MKKNALGNFKDQINTDRYLNFETMKSRIICLVIIVFSINSYSQNPIDPFNWTEPIVIPSSIYIMSSEGSNEDSLKPFLNVFFSSIVGNTVESLRKDSSEIYVGKSRKMVLEVLDIDNDDIDEILSAWEGSDSSIVLLLKYPNYEERIPVEGKITQNTGEQKRIFIEPGDFDGDSMEEFILVFLDENQKLTIQLFDSDGTLTPALAASANDEDFTGSQSNKTRFAVTTGDFDNNGDDEIAILSYDSDSDSEFEKGVYVKIYDVSGAIIVPKVKDIIIAESETSFAGNEISLDITAVPGFSLHQDLIAFAVSVNHNESPNNPDTYLQLIKTSLDLNSIIKDDNERFEEHYNDNSLPSIKVLSGDVNGDKTAELIFAHGTAFDIYSPNTDLSLTYNLGGGFSISNTDMDLSDGYDFIELSNIDNVAGDELVVAKNMYSDDWENLFPQHLSISTYGVKNDTLSSFSTKSSVSGLDEIPYTWPGRTLGLAVGNFDKTKVTIQAPRYSHRTDISQPLVILNAPPIHFDNIDGVIYDLNACFGDGDCNFISTYRKILSNTSEFTTQIQGSIDVSAGLARKGSVSVGASIEAAPLGVGGTVDVSYSDEFEYHLLATHGAHLEKTNATSFKSEVSYEVSAVDDDWIFASLTDYDIWEYPYYIGSAENQSGVILAVIPTQSEGRWFPSKSVSGFAYKPIHEVGNILSYYPYDSINSNPNIYEYVVPSEHSSTFTISSNTDEGWTLNKEEFTNNQALEGIYFGVDMGFLGYGYTVNEKAEISYNRSHTTTIGESIQLDVQIGSLDRSIGPTEYRITPYAYWSKGGALVVDYSVEPEVDLTGGSTWWQEKYGSKPDPTMILPWRNDPEKGFQITEEAKRQQTKDLSLRPSYVPIGDSALVTANIRNYSLKSTSGKVKVKFYLGDPLNGGELVKSVDGISEFETDGPIPARGLKAVKFYWIRPESSAAKRFYVAIDPDNDIDEVHENNNIGWISLQQTQSQTSIKNPGMDINNGTLLDQNYPNPFNELSTISYTLTESESITLNIHDLSGSLIKSYNEGLRGPGTYSLEIDGSLFESGIYFYTIEGISSHELRKMSIIH